MQGDSLKGQQITRWFNLPLTESEKAKRSERFFWAKLIGILGLMATVVSLGVMQVRRASAGVRTSYELVKIHDALREQVEANRHLEADLTRMKNPIDLAREAADLYAMHAPTANETVEVE